VNSSGLLLRVGPLRGTWLRLWFRCRRQVGLVLTLAGVGFEPVRLLGRADVVVHAFAEFRVAQIAAGRAALLHDLLLSAGRIFRRDIGGLRARLDPCERASYGECADRNGPHIEHLSTATDTSVQSICRLSRAALSSVCTHGSLQKLQ